MGFRQVYQSPAQDSLAKSGVKEAIGQNHFAKLHDAVAKAASDDFANGQA
jgi:hypothetical protein